MEFFRKSKKLVGSKRTRKWRRRPCPYGSGPVNHQPLPRSSIKQQIKKDVEGEKPLVLTRRWYEYS